MASGIDIVVGHRSVRQHGRRRFELKGERVNRLIIAKDVLEKLLPTPGDRIGLVAFADALTSPLP